MIFALAHSLLQHGNPYPMRRVISGSGSGSGPWLALVVTMAWTLGCGSTPPPVAKPADTPAQITTSETEPTETEPTETEPGPADAFLHSAGTGVTFEEAYDDAAARLANAVYGSPEAAALWAVPTVPLHDPDRDPMQQATAAGGRVRVDIGIGQERVEELLMTLLDQPWEPAVAAPLADVLRHAYRVHVDDFVCARRAALLAEACPQPPTRDELRAADGRVIEALAREVRLQPFYAGGVPVDAEQHPLRPIRAVAEYATANGTWVPLPALALRVTGVPDDALASALEATEGITDDTGMVSLEFVAGARWPGKMYMVVDMEQLLGPLARLPGASWPAIEVALRSRTPGMRRWSVVAMERVQGQAVHDGVFAASLSKAMRARGMGAMVALPAEIVHTLQAASPGELVGALPALADTFAGRIDALVVVDLDSEYASRMGSHRVWYEARGRAQVFDVWTGERLRSEEATVTASGVGDERADRAARTQLAEQLASQILPSS